jgi:hypothetical protein
MKLLVSSPQVPHSTIPWLTHKTRWHGVIHHNHHDRCKLLAATVRVSFQIFRHLPQVCPSLAQTFPTWQFGTATLLVVVVQQRFKH